MKKAEDSKETDYAMKKSFSIIRIDSKIKREGKGFMAKRNTQASITKQPAKSVPKNRLKVQTGHLLVISGIALTLVYEIVISRAQLVDLHYQIEKIEYEVDQLRTEKNAYYQHQAELTKLSRLKEAIQSEEVELEGSRIYRLEEN